MWFLISWGKKVVKARDVREELCPTCRSVRPFGISVVFEYVGLGTIPVFSWGARYFYHCDKCSTGLEISHKDTPITTKLQQFLLGSSVLSAYFGWKAVVSITTIFDPPLTTYFDPPG